MPAPDSLPKAMTVARPSVPAPLEPALAPPPVSVTQTGPIPFMPLEGSGQPSTPGSGPMTMAGLLRAFRRRWPLAIGAALVASLLGVLGVIFLYPARYVSSAQIGIASHHQAGIMVQTGEPTEFVIYKASLAALVKNPLVLNAAVNEVKDLPLIREQDSPVTWLERNLKTDFLLSPDVLRITLASDRPEDGAKVLNAVVNSFMQEIKSKDQGKRLMNLEQLRDNHRVTEDSLRKKREALSKRMIALGLDDPETMKLMFQTAQQNLGLAEKELNANHLEQARTEQELKARQDQQTNLGQLVITEKEINDRLKDLPAAQEIFLSMFQVEKDIQQLKNFAKSPGPLVREQEAKRARLENDLAGLRRAVLPSVEQDLRHKAKLELEDKIVRLQEQQRFLKTGEGILKKEVERHQGEVRRLNPANRPRSTDLDAMRDDIGSTQKALDKLSETIAMWTVEPTATRVSLRQSADPPLVKDYSRQLKLAGAAGLGLFGLGLAGVSLLEFRSRRIGATDEVTRDLGLTLYGTLPTMPNGARKPATGLASTHDLYWQNQMSESVDAIRTLVLHTSRADDLRVLLVTSAVAGEGKTSLASQLAASLARAWRKTLLIDGDLRNPAAHKLFELPGEPGFSEVLRGEAEAADAIKPTPLSRLWLMPAGNWDSHAVQALAQESVRSLFEQLKGQYDFIVVDSSPVLPVADTLLLGQHVDAAILSILRDVSRTPAVYAAQKRLNSLGIRTLGAVVIGANEAGLVSYQYGNRPATSPRV